MIAFDMTPTGCYSTSSPRHCIRATGTQTTAHVNDCWNCMYFVSNIRAFQAHEKKRETAVKADSKKSKAQRIRDNLKNLPHNRKSMRY